MRTRATASCATSTAIRTTCETRAWSAPGVWLASWRTCTTRSCP